MKSAADRDVYMRFYPSDWRGDENLRLCSLAARGLWMELMCLAFKAEGFVLVAGKVPTATELARLVGSTPAEVRRHVDELKAHDVCSVTDEGVIFSRRMVRDARRRAVNRTNGQQGGSPLLPRRSVAKSDNRDGEVRADSVNRESNRQPPESDNTQIYRSRSRDPDQNLQEQRAAARASHKVLVRLAHDVLAEVDAKVVDESDATEVLKQRAADAHIPYNSTEAAKALESAAVQRRRVG